MAADVATLPLSVPAPSAVPWARTVALLALLGGTIGVACDAAHVHSGTTRYTDPTFFSIAWWVVPLFASAAVALGIGPVLLERALGRTDSVPSARAATAGLALFVAAYVASCFVHGLAGVAVLLVFAAAIAAVVDRRPLGLAAAAGAAIAGPVVEITFVRLGLFEHTDPGFLGVPYWLPVLYVCASLGVSGIARVSLAGSRLPLVATR